MLEILENLTKIITLALFFRVFSCSVASRYVSQVFRLSPSPIRGPPVSFFLDAHGALRPKISAGTRPSPTGTRLDNAAFLQQPERYHLFQKTSTKEQEALSNDVWHTPLTFSGLQNSSCFLQNSIQARRIKIRHKCPIVQSKRGNYKK